MYNVHCILYIYIDIDIYYIIHSRIICLKQETETYIRKYVNKWKYESDK